MSFFDSHAQPQQTPGDMRQAVGSIKANPGSYLSQRGYNIPDGMGGSYRGYSREGRGYSREGGYSNARGRMNAQRDSRGRYSGADGDVEDIKRDMQRLMDKVEKM